MKDRNLLRRCKALAEKECAFYDQHTCLHDEHPCHVINPRHDTVHNGAVDCDEFLRDVLPLDQELHKLVWNEIYSDPAKDARNRRNCTVCGAAFVPSSPRQKYCAACGKAVKKQQNRDKQRRHVLRERAEKTA